jgi:hypothetical protein
MDVEETGWIQKIKDKSLRKIKHRSNSRIPDVLQHI